MQNNKKFWLCIGLVACTSPTADRIDAHLLLEHGKPAAMVRIDHDGPRVSVIWKWPFLHAPSVVHETWLYDDDHKLISWSRTRPSGGGRWLQITPDGHATWRVQEGDIDRQGQWTLPGRPTAWTAAQQEQGETLWWDGLRVRVGQIEMQDEDWRACTADGCWAGREGQLHVDFPDGSSLKAQRDTLAPYQPEEITWRPGPRAPHARDTRQLLATLGPRLLRHTRPLIVEIPSRPRSTPPQARRPWQLNLQPAPLDLGLPPAQDRFTAVAQTLAAVRPNRPLGIARLLRGNSDDTHDCDVISARMVAALASQHIQAEVVHGWLLLDNKPRWVRHAWVRVPFGAPTPYLNVDPALNQLIADAARLSDDEIGPASKPDDWRIALWPAATQQPPRRLRTLESLPWP